MACSWISWDVMCLVCSGCSQMFLDVIRSYWMLLDALGCGFLDMGSLMLLDLIGCYWLLFDFVFSF